MAKKETHPELFVNNEQIPALKTMKVVNTWVDILTLKWTMNNIKKSY